MGGSSYKLELYLRHRQALINYALPITGDRWRAEDVVQEAWVRFEASEDDLSGPVGYLYRIVRNLAVDVRRRFSHEKHWLTDDGSELEIAEERPSPEQTLAGHDELRLMQAVMAELPERTRRALEMHRFDDMKLKDIAVQLGISVGLAHRLVSDGLEHCRLRLKRAQ